MIRETCSCGATTEIDYGAHRASTQYPGEREAEAVATWRDCHRHEPPAPHEHTWIREETITEPATRETCGSCGATRAVEPECDHLWDRGTADFPTLGKCAKCGVPEPLEVTVVPSHAHEWDYGSKDFSGPPRCRVCGFTRSLDPVDPDCTCRGRFAHGRLKDCESAACRAQYAKTQHTGGNAEDCPVCRDRKDLPYPFICDGGKPA